MKRTCLQRTMWQATLQGRTQTHNSRVFKEQGRTQSQAPTVHRPVQRLWHTKCSRAMTSPLGTFRHPPKCLLGARTHPITSSDRTSTDTVHRHTYDTCNRAMICKSHGPYITPLGTRQQRDGEENGNLQALPTSNEADLPPKDYVASNTARANSNSQLPRL